MRLANANVAQVSVEGGAAAYVFDFGGNLRRDVAFKLTAGMSSVEIRIPTGTAAKVTTETVLGSRGHGRWLYEEGRRLLE